MCSLYLIVKLRPVCPIYALLQSGQINLYAPDCAYLSGVWYWGVSSLWIVLVVCQPIFRSVFLKGLVTNVVSLPVYVNVVNLCVAVFVSFLNVEVWHLRAGGLCVWAGNPLLERMSWIVSSSSFYSSSSKWYVFIYASYIKSNQMRLFFLFYYVKLYMFRASPIFRST